MKKYLAFAFFAAAILFSMIREWAAPTACTRSGLPLAPALGARHAGFPARHSVDETKPLPAPTALPAL